MSGRIAIDAKIKMNCSRVIQIFLINLFLLFRRSRSLDLSLRLFSAFVDLMAILLAVGAQFAILGLVTRLVALRAGHLTLIKQVAYGAANCALSVCVRVHCITDHSLSGADARLGVDGLWFFLRLWIMVGWLRL